ncbi:MAG: hypothetical protein LLG04_15435 [Parachlamydia sp.]|nr:hypothetical protein [Parachlamydia sp.]
MQYAAHAKPTAPIHHPPVRIHVPSSVRVARSLQHRSVSYKKSESIHAKQKEPTVLFHFVPPDSRDARTHFEALNASRIQWKKEVDQTEQIRTQHSLKRGLVTLKNLEQKIDEIDEIIADLSRSSIHSHDIVKLTEEKENVEKTLGQLVQHLARMKISLSS